MQNFIRYNHIENLPDPNASADIRVEEDDEFWPRNFSEVLREIKDHLTKEELLTISVYKNSKKRKQNLIYREFFKDILKKTVTGSAMTHKKKRTLMVLSHVGALLKFKRTHHIDSKLHEILTNRQFTILMLYEKRMPLPKIKEQIKIKYECNIATLFRRVIGRLETSKDVDIKRYLVLLGNVLRFSRAYPISKR